MQRWACVAPTTIPWIANLVYVCVLMYMHGFVISSFSRTIKLFSHGQNYEYSYTKNLFKIFYFALQNNEDQTGTSKEWHTTKYPECWTGCHGKGE